MVLFPAACRSSTFVCTGQTRACSRCVVVYLWSWFNEAFCDCPFGYSRGVFFHLHSVFFRHVFLQPEPTLDLYETNKNDSTSDTYVWYVCTSIHTLHHAYPRYYDTTTLQQCCCMYSGYTRRFSILLLCVCTYQVHILSYILCNSSSSSSSSSPTAAINSFVCCCLLCVIYGSIYSSVLLLLDLKCIQ